MTDAAPTLARIQADFSLALCDPMAAVPPAVRDVAGRAPKRRFDVYRNNAAIGLIEALSATYPVVLKLTGEAFFEAAARVFVDRVRPSSPLLFRYGEEFGDFLDGFAPAASVPYLGDMARLEWAWLQAYHADDVAPIALDRLKAVPNDRSAMLRLVLHPSLALIRSRWPIASLRAASLGIIDSAAVDLAAAEDVVVVRPSYDVDLRVLPAGASAFVDALRQDKTLAEAAAACTGSEVDLAVHLRTLFELGAVVSIEFDGF